MKNDISLTNVSFDFLKSSSTFLNCLLDNLSSCVLLLNKKMELQAFNEAMKAIFSNFEGEQFLYMACGEAIGCAYQIEEAVECGNTTHCCYCELRLAAIQSYLNDVVIFKEHVERPFYTQDKIRINKHLQFSTRLFRHHREKYIIMIIEDISRFYSSEANVAFRSKHIRQEEAQ